MGNKTQQPNDDLIASVRELLQLCERYLGPLLAGGEMTRARAALKRAFNCSYDTDGDGDCHLCFRFGKCQLPPDEDAGAVENTRYLVQYEIFPLRAVFQTTVDAKTREEAALIFEQEYPRGRIRKLSPMESPATNGGN